MNPKILPLLHVETSVNSSNQFCYDKKTQVQSLKVVGMDIRTAGISGSVSVIPELTKWTTYSFVLFKQ